MAHHNSGRNSEEMSNHSSLISAPPPPEGLNPFVHNLQLSVYDKIKVIMAILSRTYFKVDISMGAVSYADYYFTGK